jgi:hypothetical protein
MAASAAVTTLVDRLIALFNARSMDLPDGCFTRHTQFALNGVAFEETLGRSSTDPLILMLTRGAAGYRFTAKALQHAVPDATLQRGELVERMDGDTRVVHGDYWLSGHLRGDGAPVEIVVLVELRFRAETVDRASATVDPAQLEQLRDARLRA